MQEILDYEIRLEHLLFDFKAESKEQLFKAMVDLLHENGRLSNPDTVLKAVLDREKIRGTGLARGVAVPHAKVGDVTNVEVAIARLAEPLDFQASDNAPSKHIFLILTNKDISPNVHIHTLSSIVKCYQNEGLLKLMNGAATAEDYIAMLQGCYDDD